MAVIVETGVGVTGANSFVTVQETDDFFDARNIVSWAGATATATDKAGYLVQAADYMRSYVWRGTEMATNQAMPIPTDEIGYVHANVKIAQMLLARQAAIGELGSALGTATVKSTRKKLEGVGETEIEYADAPLAGQNSDSLVYNLLRSFIYTRGSSLQSARINYT